MKRDVDYMVTVMKTVIKPLIENGSIECSDIDLTTELGFSLEKILYNDMSGDLVIITPDRPEKSAVIGKGGWVVGKLREELGVNSIHVDAYSDMLVRIYRMEIACKKLEKIILSPIKTSLPLKNMQNLLEHRIKNLAGFDFLSVFENELKELKSDNPVKNLTLKKNIEMESTDHNAIVALSGGVDSSFSLIIAKLMGFNPVAVTVDPGHIILPEYLKNNVKKLSESLNVPHKFLEVDVGEVVRDALGGRIHPCGRCSKVIETELMHYAEKSGIPFLIFGDFLATGSQSIVSLDNLYRINLPAMFAATKSDTKELSSYFGIESRGGYGCPLINEVHKSHPHMRRYSIQRILRETRAGILEPGQALNLIMRTL